MHPCPDNCPSNHSTPTSRPHSTSPLPPPPSLSQKRIRSIFRQFDTDGDGNLSLEEMLAGTQARLRKQL